jgi:hypothetical protein
MTRSALISSCGHFRYRLGRSWNTSRPVLAFVMLNPSTADADIDDPTIRKCIGFAVRLGFGAIDVVNLFAYRAADPKALKAAGYQRGPENARWIDHAVRESEDVICGWGSNARGLAAAAETLDMIRAVGHTPKALRVTPDGIPQHPLMLPYSCKPITFCRDPRP